MTHEDYDSIIELIKYRNVDSVPKDLTVDDLANWLDGYAQCQADLIKEVESEKRFFSNSDT